jgi:glycosyltransferase involved in cell wall biosynthesis
MRVLWFTNVQLPAVTQKLGCLLPSSGGWLESLRLALDDQPDLYLGVASVSRINYAPFSDGKTTYFNILAPLGHRYVRAWIDQWGHPIDFPNAIQQCIDIIEKFKPDIIHVHGTENFYGLLKNRTTLPFLITLQGILTVIVKQFFRDLNAGDIFKEMLTIKFIKGGGIIHEYLIMKKQAQRELQVIKSCTYFTGQTEFDRNMVSLLNPAARYYHCDRVLRPPFYIYAGSWKLESLNHKIIYCVSGPNPFKGLVCLLESVAILKGYGLLDIKLRVSGQFHDTVMWPILVRHIRRLGLDGDVTWLGLTSPETIATELANDSVFVVPSHIENESQALLEAMMVGIPCVASYAGGMPSMMRDQEEGLMFQAGDPYSLAGKIQQILTNPTLAARLSDQARQTALQRHDPQRITATMIGIYHEVFRGDHLDAV